MISTASGHGISAVDDRYSEQGMGMKRLRIDPAFLLAIAIFAVLFAVTYRDDSAIVQNSRLFFDVQQLPLVTALKSGSVFAFVVPVLAALTTLVARPPARNVLGWLTSILMIVAIFLMLRLLPSSPNVSSKIAVAGGVFALIVPMAMTTAATRGAEAVPRAIHAGALGFSLFHVAINGIMAAGGYGFHSSRFLGTTVHPNFIGVQIAGCAILITASFGRSPMRNLMVGMGLAAAIAVLVLTGSRTALLTFACAFAAYWAMRGVKIWQVLLLLILAITVLGTIASNEVSSTDTQFEQYDRGGGNTRESAWKSMWAEVNAAPLLGAGKFPTSSESSYLRGWATAGILYVVLYLGFLTALVRACLHYYLNRAASPRGAAFAALLIGMLVGAIFEGFLLDTLSLSIFLVLISTIGADAGLGQRPLRRVARAAHRRLSPAPVGRPAGVERDSAA